MVDDDNNIRLDVKDGDLTRPANAEESKTTTTSWFGELVFSREQAFLVGKHVCICITFLYSFITVFMSLLCTYASACVPNEPLNMMEVGIAFLVAWNYGCYRGWRSFNNRLNTLKHMQEIQQEQVRLRQAITELGKHIRQDGQTQQQQLDEQREEQRERDNANANANTNDNDNALFHVSPPSPNLFRNEQQQQQHNLTPYNTPIPTPPESPLLEGAAKTQPIRIGALSKEREKALSKEREKALSKETEGKEREKALSKETEGKEREKALSKETEGKEREKALSKEREPDTWREPTDSLTYTPLLGRAVQSQVVPVTSESMLHPNTQSSSNALQQQAENMLRKIQQHLTETNQHVDNENEDD